MGQRAHFMSNALPGNFFVAKFPFIGCTLAVDNFIHAVTGRGRALALLSKVMPGGGEGDLKYLYGFRPSGDHYDPFAPPADPQKWALPP